MGRALTQVLQESQWQTDNDTPNVPDGQPASAEHGGSARATAEGDGDVNGDSGCAAALSGSSTPYVSRDDIFVTTKIHPRDFAADRLREMVQASRETLNV